MNTKASFSNVIPMPKRSSNERKNYSGLLRQYGVVGGLVLVSAVSAWQLERIDSDANKSAIDNLTHKRIASETFGLLPDVNLRSAPVLQEENIVRTIKKGEMGRVTPGAEISKDALNNEWLIIKEPADDNTKSEKKFYVNLTALAQEQNKGKSYVIEASSSPVQVTGQQNPVEPVRGSGPEAGILEIIQQDEPSQP